MVLAPTSSLQNYQAFGFCLRSDQQFDPWLAKTEIPVVDITIRKIDQPIFAFTEANKISGDPASFTFQTTMQLHLAGNTWGMRLAGSADFFFSDHEIGFIPHSSDYFPALQVAVLSYALVFWMELRGLRTFHGAALAWQERSFVLLADSTRGKSTLAANLLQNGASMLSDDISVIEAEGTRFRLRPGYASMRLSFEQVNRFLGQQARLAHTVPKFGKAIIPIGSGGWARFEDQKQTPARFYILDRQTTGGAQDIRIEMLGPTEAALELVRKSLVHRIPFLTKTATQRLDFISRLVSQVPTSRLVYPSGYEHLPRVCEAIQRDLLF